MRKSRIFLCSFGISLALLITLGGLITVDARGRQMSFGEEQPPFTVWEHQDGTADLEILLFGQNFTLDFTLFDKIWKFFCDFSCIPYHILI